MLTAPTAHGGLHKVPSITEPVPSRFSTSGRNQRYYYYYLVTQLHVHYGRWPMNRMTKINTLNQMTLFCHSCLKELKDFKDSDQR